MGGQEHSDTLANLGLTFWNQGPWKEAGKLDMKAI
jgi:hypothetical protein